MNKAGNAVTGAKVATAGSAPCVVDPNWQCCMHSKGCSGSSAKPAAIISAQGIPAIAAVAWAGEPFMAGQAYAATASCENSKANDNRPMRRTRRVRENVTLRTIA